MRIAILLISIILVSCAPKGEIKPLSFDGVQIIGINSTGVDVELKVTLESSFKKPIKISEAEFEALLDNKLIAQVTLTSAFAIEPLSSRQYTIPLRARINMGGMSQIMKTLSSPKDLETLKLEGTINGGIGIINKRIKFDYQLTDKDIKLLEGIR